VKGTNHVLDVVSRLKREGLAIDFRLVEGVPQAEARRIYERADLLIDQLLCGWYGGLAVEFMALGKPVICYIREGDLKFVPEQMRKDLPVINATPTTIYGVLKEWLTVRRHELEGIGRRGRAYVERWHDPLKIAAKLKGEYEAILASKQ
jgi:glycosyltransferase involved in cell wall biosynthesis